MQLAPTPSARRPAVSGAPGSTARDDREVRAATVQGMLDASVIPPIFVPEHEHE